MAVTALCQRCPQKAPTRPATAASKGTPQCRGAAGCSGPGHLQGTCEAGLNLQHEDPRYPQDPQDLQDSQDHAEPCSVCSLGTKQGSGAWAQSHQQPKGQGPSARQMGASACASSPPCAEGQSPVFGMPCKMKVCPSADRGL